MNYEARVRLLISFLSFLIGMTLGWLTGGTGLSKWWIFLVDLAFLIVIGYFIVKVFLKDIIMKKKNT